jgi:hypothetical protein
LYEDPGLTGVVFIVVEHTPAELIQARVEFQWLRKLDSHALAAQGNQLTCPHRHEVHRPDMAYPRGDSFQLRNVVVLEGSQEAA